MWIGYGPLDTLPSELDAGFNIAVNPCVFLRALVLVKLSSCYILLIVLILCEPLETCEPDKTTVAVSLKPNSTKLL